MDSRVKNMFADEKIKFGVLAEAFPGMKEYFEGTKPGRINRYDNGVMSIVINGQGKEKPSTFGYLPVGRFVFNVGGNRETMHFLHGEIDWGFGKNPTVRPKQYDILVIPAGEDLILNVKKPTLYVCDYLKQ
ncbi:MAG: DUF1255 family protein [Candidatus Thermoplasmatota archaeon]|nr:DUF1255 family protein [Euryarchaeota archaeon]MBU4032875.1 DUF1255 family protein [Candidatus Thermoplasmatota archaeon]MBU4072035.1 DUF1255 family protein [Candidatus Thermoplasmatota archaeon]MBU4144566.1 DUF1255 family protein [Candidatus Thermoplasmatota archaeon]MBU4592115.1 DUF1255 family protein [Candidatus Thermoplasmatota archaeon]